jgi:hypothetical protein
VAFCSRPKLPVPYCISRRDLAQAECSFVILSVALRSVTEQGRQSQFQSHLRRLRCSSAPAAIPSLTSPTARGAPPSTAFKGNTALDRNAEMLLAMHPVWTGQLNRFGNCAAFLTTRDVPSALGSCTADGRRIPDVDDSGQPGPCAPSNLRGPGDRGMLSARS